ncbi:MAG: hypothetical protein MJ196_07585 [Treponemataceae bacterium]|nr:hypothetical protein [Treponemataceae bacterium]
MYYTFIFLFVSVVLFVTWAFMKNDETTNASGKVKQAVGIASVTIFCVGGFIALAINYQYTGGMYNESIRYVYYNPVKNTVEEKELSASFDENTWTYKETMMFNRGTLKPCITYSLVNTQTRRTVINRTTNPYAHVAWLKNYYVNDWWYKKSFEVKEEKVPDMEYYDID